MSDPHHMFTSVQSFGLWLSATPLSLKIQTIQWIIPTVQTVHILSIAVVLSSAAVVDLRLLGLFSPGQALIDVGRRYLPWVWWTLLILLVSGATLIVGEPERSLGNPAFTAKMCMLVTVLIDTLVLQRGIYRDEDYWQSTHGRRVGGRFLAGVSLLLWVGVVCAGRWIAYIDLGAE